MTSVDNATSMIFAYPYSCIRAALGREIRPASIQRISPSAAPAVVLAGRFWYLDADTGTTKTWYPHYNDKYDPYNHNEKKH
jgi:hypothetical protein